VCNTREHFPGARKGFRLRGTVFPFLDDCVYLNGHREVRRTEWKRPGVISDGTQASCRARNVKAVSACHLMHTYLVGSRPGKVTPYLVGIIDRRQIVPRTSDRLAKSKASATNSICMCPRLVLCVRCAIAGRAHPILQADAWSSDAVWAAM
jgi:hypothetical protein